MKNLTTTALRFSLLLLLLPSALRAQNFAGYNWYFGNSPQGVRFSRSNNSATLVSNQAVPFGTGGSAVASDQVNGDLLFYTDGANIYDITNAVMPNGTGLNGFTGGNQPVAVAKVPGQLNQYYVFTNNSNFTTGGSIEYRIVDMALFGNAVFPTPALGDASNTTNTAVAGLTNRSEAMIVIPHSNGDDFWLITHANGAPDYSVTRVTPAGPTTTTIVAGLGLIQLAANFSYHPATNQLAVSPQEATRDVEVLTFDPATGALIFQQRILSSGVASTTNQAIYDIEFSANGDLVYLSRHGETGIPADVLQFNLVSTTPVSLASVLPQPNTIFRSYGLQMAPDSAIYHLYQATNGGPFLMGKITDTDSLAPKALYTPQAFAGNINFNGKQFPSFAPRDTVNLNVTFLAKGLCANAPTSFFPTVTPGADSLHWDLGDGTSTSDWSPVYTYPDAGTYDVAVTAYLNGQEKTTTQQITVTTFDTQISLVEDTTACSCELPFPKTKKPVTRCGTFSVTASVSGTGTPQLQWYGPGGPIAGATTATLAPDSAGYYYLVATVGGCSTYSGVNIKEYGIQDERANIWFFGNNAGLDFNDQPTVAIQNGVMNAPAGTSTISDRNGQVIFFTDGDKVWNRQEVELASGLGGDPTSSQAALIIPVPGDETLYYIFTTKEIYGGYSYEMRYALFDLKMNNGTGGIVDPDNNPATSPSTLLFVKSTERVTGSANWLIAHEYGNNSFRAYRVTQQGLGNPVISSIGSDHNFATAANGQGYMKLGARDRLAVALSTPGASNVVEVFDFTDSTGTVSNFRTADLKNANGQVYGVEFSPGGNKLFASLKNSGSSQIVEFAFDSLSIPYLKKPPIAPVSQTLGAIQTGPDGQIYVAVDGQNALGTIQASEDTTQVSTFRIDGMPLLSGTNSRLGLPNFIQHISDPAQGPGISIAGECVQDSVSFSGSPRDPIDTYAWTVSLGGSVITTSKEQSFKFLFSVPGTYHVALTLHNRCVPDTLMQRDHIIYGAPPNPTASAVICTGPVVLDANPNNLTGLTYAWSTGATTETITVSRQAVYNVTVTNAAGCTVNGQILAADNRPVVDLGPNLTICQNTPIATLDARNPGTSTTYAWTINNVPSGATRTQAVNTSVPGPPTFEYEVTVTDGITTCFAKDSVIYTINPLPTISTPLVVNPSACLVNDGSINFDITGPTNGTLFSYFITGPSTSLSGTDRSLGAVPAATGLGAGTYGITVADQVSGCALTTTASLNNTSFTVAGTPTDVCNPMGINVTTVPAVGALTYRIINNTTLAVIESGAKAGTPFVTATLPNADYVVEITSLGCTASSTPVILQQNSQFTVTFDTNDICANQNVKAIAAGATTFDWSLSQTGSVIAPTNADVVKVNTGDWMLRVKVDDGPGNTCPTIDSIAVKILPPLVANFTQTDGCADQVTINATPNGPYLYRWFVNGAATPDPTLAGPQITVTSANDGFTYGLTIYDPVNGCTSSFSNTVQVDGTLSATLTSSPPCEGSLFTLTATPSRAATFAWAFNGNTISGQTAATLQDERSGNYTVTVTAATCQATADLDIIVNPVTPGLMRDEALICPDPANPDPNTREVVLVPGEFNSYDWFKDGVSLGITTPTLVASEVGIFSVNLVNGYGCASNDKTTVKEQCDPVIVGPNAFRPTSSVQGQGGDYVNQSFKLFTFFIDDMNFQIFIFNRWGEMIYQSDQRDFRWNGGYNNNASQQAPPGTYSYVVRYQSSYRPEKGVQEKRGGVVLLR
ncbi:PKD domain-containing protein [Chryseolinea lacunae]|uniref:Gliding motility-associated C-terminal domain-containing protein n=1 Tax=Chryseolinea lacunae TaxID=2801331 RepID=A0ABS1KN49_9BACT|nr:PKD domain-containing protein [Chryseolinea lacunae]MBL0740107.1 gliding motility-associated C-terminal domain-containing protein [Chryseolinea lacunae]